MAGDDLKERQAAIGACCSAQAEPDTCTGFDALLRMVSMAAAALAVLLPCLAAMAAELPESRVIAIPRFEAEQVIADWLKQGGYKLGRKTRTDAVQLSATRKSSELRVTLRHHSPMATEVAVEARPAEKSEELWKYLGGYLQGYSMNHGSGKGSRESPGGIPGQIAAKMDLVVCIQASADGRPTQLSGFVVDASGLIICTAHTLKKPKGITITLSSGKTLEGRLMKIDFQKDLALIDCSHAFSSPIPLNGSGIVPEMGQRVYAIGCPLNNRGTVSSGYVDGPPGLVDGQPLLQVKMEVEPGSSGSPVFDQDGNLVAVVKGRLKGGNASGLLIPMDTLISFVKEK